ncbi:putative oligopeptide transport ATP-binding protein YkfD [Nocardia camponoti]|uniref:Oligopeptide transport ATP-binding protein YkfD n=1 Tax=Nocardia camponoti TaxID=1616106 RepID=A0A917VBL9_9NOCA|nr:oligopeptide/dipeptide ABC transporter ATP-binding protein [Nocardia camponoti]GGK61856.1 putative oligopeptide transport ATP-binding protein YkfD [Nocardia camponoti]
MSDNVIEVDGLEVVFTSRRGLRTRRLRAIDGVSFAVRKGETFGLVGESGGGKSTLVRTLFGINKPTAGKIEILGQDLATLSPRQRRALRNRVQLVFQDPYSSLDPRMTAHDIVAEPLWIAGGYTKARVVELLDQVGLTSDVLQRKPAEFSGGQRQRLGIARALALEPEVLVLDEPVSALDASVQAQVINLLEDLQERLDLSYLFIAHDLSVVRHLCDRVGVLHLGKLVEIGDTATVFAAPAHPYTRALLAAVPIPDPHQRARDASLLVRGELPDAANPPSGCTFRTRCPEAQPVCAATEPTLSPVAGEHTVSCLFPLERITQ